MTKKKEKLILPTPKNPNQKLLINSIQTADMTVTLGPAGTGKSYICATLGGYLLRENRVKKIVITRPNVPTGRSIGYFPGSLDEKMAPWVRPILGSLEVYLGKGAVECHIKNGNIEVLPFETVRGRSFEDCFVILDEAQNCTREEIKAFVTRLGERSKMVINGDVTQSDLYGSSNGLSMLVELIKNSGGLSKHVPVVSFTRDDIVRSGLCQMFVEAFELAEDFAELPDEPPAFLQLDRTQTSERL